jgi:hypothetical protein
MFNRSPINITSIAVNQQTYSAYLCGARRYGRQFSVEEAVKQHA